MGITILGRAKAPKKEKPVFSSDKLPQVEKEDRGSRNAGINNNFPYSYSHPYTFVIVPANPLRLH